MRRDSNTQANGPTAEYAKRTAEARAPLRRRETMRWVTIGLTCSILAAGCDSGYVIEGTIAQPYHLGFERTNCRPLT
jgi:hypothetical protein